MSQHHQVSAITTSVVINDDYSIKKFEEGNFSWIVVPQRKHSFRFNGNKMGFMLDFFGNEQKLMVNCIKEIAPDIVHAHWSYEFAGAGIKSGFPCLITVHDNANKVLLFFKNFYRFGRLLMAEYNLRKVRFASTVSPYMQAYTEKRCKAVKVIANPVFIEANTNEINNSTLLKCQTLAAPRLIMINNGWDARKNGMCALLAYKELQQRFPQATIHPPRPSRQ